MIYLVRHGHDVFQDNPGLLAVEQYARLTDKQMKFVLILCDPSKDNPVKTLSGRDRRERSAVLAGYPLESDGKRLAKNGRELVYGKIKNVEEAIEEFQRNNYNQIHHSKEALKKQIVEIREFLKDDKRIPLVHKGKVVLDKEGKEVYVTDQKGLKLAVELGVKLPELEDALKKLEEDNPEDTKFEGAFTTSHDIPEEQIEEVGESLNTIEIFHKMNQKKE
jgi:hypothetical protein